MNFCYLYDICCFICVLFSLVASLTEIKHDLTMIVAVSWCWAWLPAVESNTIFYELGPVCIGNQTSAVSPLGTGSGWHRLGLRAEPASGWISNMHALECSKQAIALDNTSYWHLISMLFVYSRGTTYNLVGHMTLCKISEVSNITLLNKWCYVSIPEISLQDSVHQWKTTTLVRLRGGNQHFWAKTLQK